MTEAGLAQPPTQDQAMTDDEIMRQLSKAVRDDNLLAAEEMVTTGQQRHPEWNWPLLATVLWSNAARCKTNRSCSGNRPGGGGCAGWSTVATG
jgi:hypothetical protein